jgi:hypothetical protein
MEAGGGVSDRRPILFSDGVEVYLEFKLPRQCPFVRSLEVQR